MKLQFMSDLHIDHYNHFFEIQPVAPNLALIGDIAQSYTPKMYKFLDSISSEFERVFFIPGNHEYYGSYIDHTDVYLQDLCKDLDIEFLQKKTVEVDGVLISGCTLWSHATPSGFHKTNDERWIKNFDQEKMVAEHKQHLAFLEQELHKNRKKPHVVLTHYAPMFEMNGIWQNGENNCMFATDLKYLFQHPLKYWLCGHVHQNLTNYHNGIPCITNCFGEPEELDIKESFNPYKTIEVVTGEPVPTCAICM
jgi:Icc-related predicted phosphoesterase